MNGWVMASVVLWLTLGGTLVFVGSLAWLAAMTQYQANIGRVLIVAGVFLPVTLLWLLWKGLSVGISSVGFVIRLALGKEKL